MTVAGEGRHTWPAVLGRLIRAESLDAEDTAWAMGEVMSGQATPAQLAGFVLLLRAKGETPAELAGLVRTMLANAAPVQVPGPALDVVGTGGDRAHTVNISTMSALVAAGFDGRAVGEQEAIRRAVVRTAHGIAEDAPGQILDRVRRLHAEA